MNLELAEDLSGIRDIATAYKKRKKVDGNQKIEAVRKEEKKDEMQFKKNYPIQPSNKPQGRLTSPTS